MLVRKPMIPDFPLSAWNKCTLQEARASQVMLVVKNIPANEGNIRDEGLIPGLGKSPGGGHGNALQYSCLENSMGRRAWEATVHSVLKSKTQLKWLSTCAHLEAKASFFFSNCVYLLLPSCTPFDLSGGHSAFEQVDSLLKVTLSGKVSSFAKWRIIPSISPSSSTLPTFCYVSRLPALMSSIYSWCDTSSRNSLDVQIGFSVFPYFHRIWQCPLPQFWLS